MSFSARDLPLTELLGVLAVSGGLIALVFIGGRPGRKDLPAIAAAVLTGLTIAAYTVIDGVGVMHAPLFAYTGWMFQRSAGAHRGTAGDQHRVRCVDRRDIPR